MVDLIALVPVFISLFAIVDPVAAVPVFIALTRGASAAQRRRIALKGVVVAAAVLVAFGLAGDLVFRTFGITIPAFRVAGGLLIFKYAFDMLHGERPGEDGRDEEIAEAVAHDAERPRARRDALEGVGITPIGIPLLSGPGAIATMMVFVSGAPDAATRMGIYAAALLVFALSFAMLVAAAGVDRVLGHTGMMVTIRLMGLLLAAVAVQFVADGTMGLVDLYLESRA